jgi:uncharacterized protein YndB with AHSA1/START domain
MTEKMKQIYKEMKVAASVSDVWNAFTTSEGIKTFFAPDAKIELKLGGSYEIYFYPPEKRGSRGSEGCNVLSYIPKRMLSFTWNTPPEFPNVRKERTWVVLEFEDLKNNSVLVRLTHLGWKEGKEWDEVYNYFDRAWGIVVTRLRKRFEEGPTKWD